MDTPDGPLQVGVTSVDTCRVPPVIRPPCTIDTKLLTVELFTDDFPEETSWTLRSICTGELQASVNEFTDVETYYKEEYCLLEAEYEFTIFDSFGDGLLGMVYGNYTVTFDGDEVAFGEADFGSSESHTFGNQVEPCFQRPGIYSRVSSGMEWIERALECKESGRSGRSGKSSRSGKSGKTSKTRKQSSKSGKSRKQEIVV